MNPIPQYSQVANVQLLAAQQHLATQQKQAEMFSSKGGGIRCGRMRGGGGSDGLTAPNMGGNNPAAQNVVNGIAAKMALSQSQALNDGRMTGGKRKKKRTQRKKHNKRITKRKQYKKK